MDTFHSKIKKAYTDDVIFNNEIEANYISCCVAVILSTVLIIVGIIHFIDPLPYGPELFGLIGVELVVLMVPAYACFACKCSKIWNKYLLIIGVTAFCAILTALLTFRVPLLLVIPVLLSARYFKKNLTWSMAIVIGILFIAATVLGVFFGMKTDLNYVVLTPGEMIQVASDGTLEEAVAGLTQDSWATLWKTLARGFIPQAIFYVLASLVASDISQKGLKIVLEQEEITKKTSRISSELALAENIQRNMLPSIFPPFPDHKEFDIYAKMIPAKEVGGDCYDFYLLDQKRLGFLVADASGKGVPAALFMMVAKSLIQQQASLGSSPAEALTSINAQLCEHNDTGLFITAWLGILNLETGVLTYSCAGHNPPIIKSAAGTAFPKGEVSDGSFKYLKDRSGLVLGGMPGIKYKESELQLHPGDRIFLYTDGVTEALNTDRKLYGEERLLDLLNNCQSNNPREVIETVKADVDRFAGEAEQFDDITMLEVSYNSYPEEQDIDNPLGPDAEWEARKFSAEDCELEAVLAFAEDQLEKYDCPMRYRMQLTVAVEEIFVNIAHYAYVNGKGDVEVLIGNEKGRLLIEFVDTGEPFNPIAKEEPDITLSADERRIGGLGIFMVRKIMDEVNYEYKDGKNILRLFKQIGA